jgi:hypothetical protein
MKVLADREVSPQLGLLKSTLLQLDSTFSERSYGAGSFLDFAQKLEKAGVLKVYQAKGGWLISAVEGAPAATDASGIEAAATNGAAPEAVAEAPADAPDRPVRRAARPMVSASFAVFWLRRRFAAGRCTCGT